MNSIVNAIISILFNKSIEVELSLSALQLKLKEAGFTLSDEEVAEELTGLVNKGKVELTKDDNVRLTEVECNEQLALLAGIPELHRRSAIHHLTEEQIVEGYTGKRGGIDLQIKLKVPGDITVNKLPEGQADSWLHDLKKAHGDRQTTLQDAYGVALITTQYVKFLNVTGPVDNAMLAHSLSLAKFVDDVGVALPVGTTVTVHEKNLEAHCWIKLTDTGVHEVLYHVNHRDHEEFILASTLDNDEWPKDNDDVGDLCAFADHVGLQWDAVEGAVIVPEKCPW